MKDFYVSFIKEIFARITSVLSKVLFAKINTGEERSRVYEEQEIYVNNSVEFLEPFPAIIALSLQP